MPNPVLLHVGEAGAIAVPCFEATVAPVDESSSVGRDYCDYFFGGGAALAPVD